MAKAKIEKEVKTQTVKESVKNKTEEILNVNPEIIETNVVDDSIVDDTLVENLPENLNSDEKFDKKVDEVPVIEEEVLELNVNENTKEELQEILDQQYNELMKDAHDSLVSSITKLSALKKSLYSKLDDKRLFKFEEVLDNSIAILKKCNDDFIDLNA